MIVMLLVRRSCWCCWVVVLLMILGSNDGVWMLVGSVVGSPSVVVVRNGWLRLYGDVVLYVVRRLVVWNGATGTSMVVCR